MTTIAKIATAVAISLLPAQGHELVTPAHFAHTAAWYKEQARLNLDLLVYSIKTSPTKQRK